MLLYEFSYNDKSDGCFEQDIRLLLEQESGRQGWPPYELLVSKRGFKDNVIVYDFKVHSVEAKSSHLKLISD